MNRMQINGTPFAGDVLFRRPLTARVQPARIASGALGEHFCAPAQFADEDEGVKRRGYVSRQEADKALRKLMGIQSEGDSTRCAAVRDVLEMDPMMLSLMMTQLVLKACGNSADVLCRQLEHVSEVQAVLRDKQVAEYQDQINKAVEQAAQVRKAGIVSAVFDWIISGVEVVTGVLKMIQGVLTADPLAIADGAAYFSAGMAGMVKAGAETALLLGADKSVCNDIIKAAGIGQMVCEGVALTLDIFQIGRGISAARAITKATEEVLDTGVGKALTEAVAKGAENELKTLAEKAGQEVSRMMSKDAGMVLECGMAEVSEIAAETAAHELKAESDMVRSISKSFTRKGIGTLVETAIEGAGKDLLKKSEEVVAKKLRDAILKNLRNSIVKTVTVDCTRNSIFFIRFIANFAGGMSKISVSLVALASAKLQRDIDHLMMQQDYIDFMQNWTEDRKKTQQKGLEQTYQNSINTLRICSEIIDNSGTVLANIAGQRA
ncbi:type III secretion system translocon subunit SctE [Morganella morganii]|uniref:type III secretion system translocon subunit SctE n=1 Tax=Morganella morganii TaxID=582 RepID=UPI0021CFA3E7|nr:type III secretion system translocon subunit SctE [Morganella morganii]